MAGPWSDERPLKLGVVMSDPHDGLAMPVSNSLVDLGYDTIPLVLDEPWTLDAVTDLVVVGPMFGLTRLFARLPMSASSWPQISVWLTEQTPNPTTPGWQLRAALSAVTWLSQLETRGGRRWGRYTTWRGLQQQLHRAQRLRIAAQLRWLHGMNKLARLATMTPSHAHFYQDRIGIPATCIPYGYETAMGRDLGLPRDIDVLFLGSTRDARRGPIIQRLRQELAARNISMVVRDGSADAPHCFGEERTILINRSKIFLNVMRQPWDDLVYRMMLAAPNGAMVVSEPVLDDKPFTPGNMFVVAPCDDLPDTISTWLKDQFGRARIVDRAAMQISTHFNISRMTKTFLEGEA